MLHEAAPGVWVTQASLYLTNTTVIVGRGGDALVVDPAATREDLRALAAEIGARGWRVRAGFSTHPHWDHLLWTPELGDVPRWAMPAAVQAAQQRRGALLAEARADLGEAGVDVALFGRLTPLPADATTLPWAPVPVTVRPLPAHARGSAALLLPEGRTLVVGDLVSDVEVPLLDLEAVDPLADYAGALDEVAMLVEAGALEVLVPGHGRVASAAEARRRLALDRTYLADLRARRSSSDPRLAPGWIGDAHRAQVRAIAPRRAPDSAEVRARREGQR